MGIYILNFIPGFTNRKKKETTRALKIVYCANRQEENLSLKMSMPFPSFH